MSSPTGIPTTAIPAVTDIAAFAAVLRPSVLEIAVLFTGAVLAVNENVAIVGIVLVEDCDVVIGDRADDGAEVEEDVAAAVEAVDPTVKVAIRALGAGALNLSPVGLLQLTLLSPKGAAAAPGS
jgi:hypothetical protein